MNEKWFLIPKNRNKRKSGIEAGIWNRCVYYSGSADLLELTQESKKQILFTGFAFLLFAGNYAIYVISKKWLQVVLMAPIDFGFKPSLFGN
jgi:hypothetical protein